GVGSIEGGGRMNPGDARKAQGFQRHERSVGDSGVRARRWQLRAANPIVQAGLERPPEPDDRIRILLLLAAQIQYLADSWRKRAGEVLQSGEEVDPSVVGRFDVALAVRRGVNERAGPRPILVGGVGVEDLRQSARGSWRIQQSLRRSAA